MAKEILPTVEQLHDFLICDSKEGRLFWKERPLEFFVSKGSASSWNTKYAGREAFTAVNRGGGYKVGAILCNLYRAHRVIWAMHHGYWPSDMLDHINGDRSDNRLENLREAGNIENQWNRKKTGVTSRFKGVSWDKQRGLWSAKISVSGKTLNLGRFACELEAHASYARAALSMRGEFARI